MHCRLAAVILLLLAIALLSGCAGARETDDIAYVLAIGIDRSAKAPDQYDVTYQIAVAKAIGGGEGGGEGQTVVTTTITATNLAEARNLLKSTVSRVPNLSHNKIFIFGEALAREGIGDIIAPFVRYREFRGSMFIMVVNEGTAKEFMDKNKPKLETLTSRYYESMILTSDETSYYLKSTMHEFYIRLKSGNAAPFAVMGGFNTGQSTPKPDRTRFPGEKTDEFYAGNVPRGDGGTETQTGGGKEETKEGAGENPIDVMGTALFRQDKMVGMLTGEETRMLSILRNEFTKGFLIVPDPLVPKKAVNIAARLGEPPKIKVRMENGRALIDIRVLIEGEVTSLPSGINYENKEYRPLLEQASSNLVKMQIEKMLKRTQELGSDVAGFGYFARRHVSTSKEWEQIRGKWPTIYQQAQINVNVETKVRRFGLLFRTSPIIKEE